MTYTLEMLRRDVEKLATVYPKDTPVYVAGCDCTGPVDQVVFAPNPECNIESPPGIVITQEYGVGAPAGSVKPKHDFEDRDPAENFRCSKCKRIVDMIGSNQLCYPCATGTNPASRPRSLLIDENAAEVLIDVDANDVTCGNCQHVRDHLVGSRIREWTDQSCAIWEALGAKNEFLVPFPGTKDNSPSACYRKAGCERAEGKASLARRK